ncbi:prenyltransferase [Streptomyces sp. ET3-23]|uniref:prenyltransferase/squalene oxidase repeat-containing protein n=1 Tax=Streptomyces sp. ET3-23 TaxID=2885643 RepID=UPI001D121B14|nr:prenyltransferase/squalene oxidase repeat-containing protein [Streptomyces sp. ET3-23]MCC2280933.1 prenyltransferase [Streptomyces sp. ET3-23]
MSQDLLDRMLGELHGCISPSVYESARLVSLAPWLPGHEARLQYLLDEQRPDGLWGGAGGYAVVPSLSAVEALLTAMRDQSVGFDPVVRAANRGLHAVASLLIHHPVSELPDTVAVELIVPALVKEIELHVQRLRGDPVDGLDLVKLPTGLDDSALARIKRKLLAGMAPPQTLLHTLEVLGEATASVVKFCAPMDGIVCGSPAATAAWLRERSSPGMRSRLEAVAANGPVPSAESISVFERSWSLAWLLAAGVPVAPPDDMVQGLEAALGPDGAPGGSGLPPDADDTAVVLHALALLGRPQPLEVLRTFETPTHFACSVGERTASPSVNSHVLEALGSTPTSEPWRTAAASKVVAWLTETQHADGCWEDKWHASPYYATACCALALHRYGGRYSGPAVDRAVAWIRNTQQAVGGWGVWGPTTEETSYAVRLLATAENPTSDAVQRGTAFLRGYVGLPRPLLWHDKDLYAPHTIVDASIFAAEHLATTAGR